MRVRLAFAAAVAAGCFASPASAALLPRADGFYYDSVLDITWMTDANFARTANRSPTGLVNQQTANSLAAFYQYLNPETGVLAADWRLPTLGPDVGDYAPTLPGLDGQYPNGQGALGTGWGTPDDSGIYSELGWMYYANLGGHPRCVAFVAGVCQVDPGFGLPRDDAGDRLLGPFGNLQPGHYWTDVRVQFMQDGGVADTFWSFTFFDGNQSPRPTSQANEGVAYVWLVHDGDVAPGLPIPAAEPPTWGLLLAGFGAMGAALRRRRLPMHPGHEAGGRSTDC